MKKIYIVRDENNFGCYMAYYTNKKEVEKYVKEHKKARVEEVETEKWKIVRSYY